MPLIDISGIPDTDVGREARLSAAAIYEATGDKFKSALAGGVRNDVFDAWLQADWWPLAAEAARQSLDSELKGRLAAAARSALSELETRITLGDEQLDRNGNLHRVAVSAKDLAVIAAVSIDKRQLVSGKPTTISSGVRRDELLNALRERGQAPGPVPEAPKPAAPSLAATEVEARPAAAPLH